MAELKHNLSQNPQDELVKEKERLKSPGELSERKTYVQCEQSEKFVQPPPI